VLCDNSDGINPIQPDAFLSNQTRVPCSQIPRLNLRPWREDVCFYRARVEPRNFNFAIRTFSRSIQANFILTSASILASAQSQFECVPFQCPTRRVATDIVVYSSIELLNTARITQNPALPASSLTGFSGAYRAFWPRSQIESGVGGVFFTLAACQGGSEAALTFSVPSTEAAEVEAQLLAKAAQDGDSSSDNPESPESDEVVPEPILEVLKKPNPLALVESVPAAKTSASVQETASVESDEQLLNDLESALEKLHNHK